MAAAIAALAPSAQACSLAFWNANPEYLVAGRTMDLYFDDQPSLLVNPKGMKRGGGTPEKAHSWTSSYASVAITGFGRSDASSAGLNEAGLLVNALYHKGAKLEAPDARPCVSGLACVQFLLDTAGSVREALAALEKVRICPAIAEGKEWPLHLALNDATGDSAVVEFVDGEMQVGRGRQFNVLTNEPNLDAQLANLKKYRPFGGQLPLPGDIDPASRFVRLSAFAASMEPATSAMDAVAKMRSLLWTVSATPGAKDYSEAKLEDAWPTRWSAIFDLKGRIVYLSLSGSLNTICLDLKKLDLGSGAPQMELFPISPELSGDVAKELKPVSRRE